MYTASCETSHQLKQTGFIDAKYKPAYYVLKSVLVIFQETDHIYLCVTDKYASQYFY